MAKKQKITRLGVRFEPDRLRDAYLIEVYEMLIPGNKKLIENTNSAFKKEYSIPVKETVTCVNK